MRDHGVANFPDPQVTHTNGGTQIAIRVVGPSSPNFSTAQTACRGILPAPSKSDLAAQAKQQLAEKQGHLAFAHCMRDHGISGFPDPTAQGRLTLPMVQAAGIDLTAPQVRTAALDCVPDSDGTISRANVIQATSGNPQGPGSSSGSATSSNP
jgi:hypothetical protein